MTYGDDSEVDLHRVDAFAFEDELTIEEFLQAAPTARLGPGSRGGGQSRRCTSGSGTPAGCCGWSTRCTCGYWLTRS
jgi:hypothetical protein